MQYYHPAKMFVVFFVIFLRTVSPSVATSAEVKIEAKLPVNPVKHGGFLSVYCQIWNMKDVYKVTISRILKSSSQTEMLSWGPAVLQDINDDRVMLAVRTIEDGSTVYFLSILDITREDEGTYICKVRNLTAGEQIIGNSSVIADVNYFPGESNPTCSPGEPIVVAKGREIVLNCSSAVGKPKVDFKWRKTSQHDSGFTLDDNVHSEGTHSVLKFKPSYRDDNAIFVCEISSTTFPQLSRTCHVGPITVLRDKSKKPPSTTMLVTPKIRETKQDIILPTVASSSSCSKVCTTWNSDVYYWIISTIVFSIIALVFIIVGFCLLLRYYKLSSSTSVNTAQMRIYNDTEDTYEKLEYRNDRKVYMALDKSWVPTHGPIELQTHYNVTPLGQTSMPSQYHDMLT